MTANARLAGAPGLRNTSYSPTRTASSKQFMWYLVASFCKYWRNIVHRPPTTLEEGVEIKCQGVMAIPVVVSQSDQTTEGAFGSVPPVGSMPTLFLVTSGSAVLG